jgi:dTDP-4-amino-4,6-dideoxygalactose transaminase
MNNKIDVPYVDLGFQWTQIRDEALSDIDRILSSGNYLEHEKLYELESRIGDFLGVKEIILLNSGTDALLFSLFALGIKPGDEVITVANSYIATVAAIQHVGAIPIFADVGKDHLIDPDSVLKCISGRTRAILPVHLEGKVCNMFAINKIALEHDLFVIEDSAQAFGSKLKNKFSGSFADISCFSLHPLKNLNSCGDGGFVATNNRGLSTRIRQLANHGQSSRNISTEFGFVSRLDSLQAAVLGIRLRDLEEVIKVRRRNAKAYNEILGDSLHITLPIFENDVYHTYHTYVVEVSERNKVVDFLLESGIETKIHYPKLITEQIAFKGKGFKVGEIPNTEFQNKRVLSLPIAQHLSLQQIHHTAKNLLKVLNKI